MMITSSEVLQQEFNIETHKKHFVNYLEVIIYPDGRIEYAVPSHNIKLFMITYEKTFRKKLTYNSDTLKKQRDYEMANVGREWWMDMIQFYCNKTGCISVWNDRCIAPSSGLTTLQKKTMRALKRNGLYKGHIPFNQRSVLV